MVSKGMPKGGASEVQVLVCSLSGLPVDLLFSRATSYFRVLAGLLTGGGTTNYSDLQWVFCQTILRITVQPPASLLLFSSWASGIFT